ncbi:latexin [Electrophorus electricus]|uniref:Cystatin LXN-type domain-containing protein n=1 Tax=Electrophorus electricus TaxID=8005 RepID=A0A4W4FNX5_ELEEL|nr:latexin [Electrophorus electricus]
MHRFCSVCVVLFSLVWPCLVQPQTPTSQPLGLTSLHEGNCSCALRLHHTEPTSQEGLVMTSRELNPQFYEASRAGRVVQHHLNTLYGSPFRVYVVTQVHTARTEDTGDDGMKYVLEFSVKDWASEGPECKASAEVLYPRGDVHQPPKVQSSPDGLLQANTSDKEQAFYQRYSAAAGPVSAKDIPDSYGHIDPEMEHFWHLAWVASSFIMLNESSENTLYSLAQVAKVTQLNIQDGQLRFELQVLLHDMVSQNINRWKLQVSWSPADGVQVLEMELLPRCHCKSQTRP